MNRIYQGRISKLEVFVGKDSEGKDQWNLFGFTREKLSQFQKEREGLQQLAKNETSLGIDTRKQLKAIEMQLNHPWQTALWEHHQSFQDAINYYILALASLADPQHATNRLLKDLWDRVRVAWAKFPRPVEGEARCMRQSVASWLNLASDASLNDAFAAILDGNQAEPRVRMLAMALLLDRCGGEAAIQQGGRGYLPRFCDAKAKPTYDFSSISQAAGLGKNQLAQVLHAEASESELAKIAEAMDVSWTVKLQPGEFFTPEDSVSRLHEAIKHIRDMLQKPVADRVKEVTKLFPDFEEQFDSFKAVIDAGSREFVIPRNRKASKDLTFATLAFKFFPCPLTAKILSLFIKKPKAITVEKNGDKVNFASYGDDPIKLSRGDRGFVFRAFTALPAWNPKSPGEPVWKEFDIAAFKEALKSLNQFNQKTQERTDDENNLRGQLAIMLGSGIKGWKPRKTETNDDEPTPELLDPGLFQLARELESDLTQDLADTVVGEERAIEFGAVVYKYREGGWQISSASLRGYRNIAEEWNVLHAKSAGVLAAGELEDVVKKYQRDEKNKNSIGSISLFLRLCEKKYWPLWLAQDEDSEDPSSEKSFLELMVAFHTKFRDFERSLEPINLTPAEPKHSRRLYMFSDLTDKTARVGFGKTDEGFTVECAIAMRSDNGGVSEQRVRLIYSAKRLLRDELQGGVESRWLQPMTRALGLEMPESAGQVAFESAVSLMPDFGHSTDKSNSKDLRFLLNFPVTLDPAWIHSGLGKSEIWKGQFNGIRDKNLHLHWPGTIKGKGSESPWWKKKHIVECGFTCISVDLGQRVVGAWALLRITCLDPTKTDKATKRPVRKIGFDGERTWFSEVLSTGILRLPGEDQKIIGPYGKEVEHFGKSGRNARESEWMEGKELAKALLAQNPEAWLGKTFTEKSLPEQNDALLALANRRLSRLNTFHRWSCFDPERPEVTARRSNLIDKLLEELAHWEDAEVETWSKLIEKEDFAGFRTAAGSAFDSLRLKLGEHLVTLANRVAPLRNRSWLWDQSKGNAEQGLYGELLDTGNQLTENATWIRGQRGLSLSRVEQLENLRRLFLRYNRSFDRQAKIAAKFGSADSGRRSGEPCRTLLEKIDRMKEQRVNQTAHLVLAEALGVRLKKHQIDMREREDRDIHGEYEKIPGREPVDFVVIENLDRYLTSQGRGPSENSRLMKWAHRAVREKIKMLAEEPFGIPVVEAAAAYSSRFCAITGVAGARCEERAKLDDHLKESLENRAKRPPKFGQPHPEVFTTLLNQFNELERLNGELKKCQDKNKKKSNSLYTLFLPKQGGPLFLPVREEESDAVRRLPKQADINAAVNIGLRAIAAPDAFDILHKVRAQKESDCLKPVVKNTREKAVFDSKTIITLKSKASNKLLNARSPNFFFDAKAFNCFDTAILKSSNQTVSLVSGVGLWTAVNESFSKQLTEINRQRLEAWRKQNAKNDGLTY